ncbi:hypothetical protein Tco_0832607, partial [Tanacetum coccineum]
YSPAPVAVFTAQVLANWNTLYDAYNEVACLMLGNDACKNHSGNKHVVIWKLVLMLFSRSAGLDIIVMIMVSGFDIRFALI